MPPLTNANNLILPANVGGLPDVSAAVMELLQPVTVEVVTQQLINGYYNPIKTTIATQASVQAMKQELAIKMEGERNWDWKVIHILPNVDLRNNDFITLFGVQYKIMGRENWFQYGYIMYHTVVSFQNAPTT